MRGRDAGLTLALVLTTLTWGAAFTAVKQSTRTVDPIDFAIWRYLVAGVAFGWLLVLLPRFGVPSKPFSARDWGFIFFLGAVGVAGYHAFFNIGIRNLARTSSGESAAILASFIISTSSLFVVLLTPFTTKERLTRRRVGGILVALVGTSLLFLVGRDARIEQDVVAGLLLITVAPFAWAVYNVVTKRWMAHHSSLRVTSWSMMVGTLFLLPFSDLGFFQRAQTIAPVNWMWIVVLGLLATFAGYLAWMVALAFWDATRVSAFVYLVPLFATAWAIILEGESLTTPIIAGGGLILLGVWLVNRPGRARLNPLKGAAATPEP